MIGGPDGSRTRDLVNAIHARSQLRHWPTLFILSLPLVDNQRIDLISDRFLQAVRC